MSDMTIIGARLPIPEPENKLLVSFTPPVEMKVGMNYILIIDTDAKTAQIGMSFAEVTHE